MVYRILDRIEILLVELRLEADLHLRNPSDANIGLDNEVFVVRGSFELLD